MGRRIEVTTPGDLDRSWTQDGPASLPVGVAQIVTSLTYMPNDLPAHVDRTLASLVAIEAELRASGLQQALAILNGRTRHRYTGAYIIDPPKLRNHCLYDRENPEVRVMGDLVLRDSYCGIVAEHGVPFTTSNSMADPRLEGHPLRELIVAYHGYPLRDPTGRCFGTLCHWDERPRLTPASEIPLIMAVAPLVARKVLDELGQITA